MAKDLNDARLRKAAKWQEALYDTWAALKDLTNAEITSWDAFSKAVQEAFNKRQAEFKEGLKKRQDLLHRLECKKFNLEAVQYSKRIPFPAEQTPPDELVRQAQLEIAALRALTQVRQERAEADVASLLSAAEDSAEDALERIPAAPVPTESELPDLPAEDVRTTP